MTVDSDNICEATHGRDESPQHSNSAIAFSTISVVHTISSSSNSKPVGDAEVLEFSSHDEVRFVIDVDANHAELAAHFMKSPDFSDVQFYLQFS